MPRIKILLVSGLVFGLSAFAGHRAFLEIYPYLRTRHILGLVTRQTFVEHRWLYVPSSQGRARNVRRISPDILIAYCLFDISDGKTEVVMRPWGAYQSASIFSMNSDHYYTKKSLNGELLSFTISQEDVPFRKGFIIMRRFVNGRNHQLSDTCRKI